jgi:hypothetical protein
MRHDIVIKTDCDGRLRFLYTDDMTDLIAHGHADIRRASHVEPGECGCWYAFMDPVEKGTVLGPFRKRREALAAEVRWLRRHGY